MKLLEDSTDLPLVSGSVPDLFRLSVLLRFEGEQIRFYSAARPVGAWNRWPEQFYGEFLTGHRSGQRARRALDELMSHAEVRRFREILFGLHQFQGAIISTDLERIEAPWVTPEDRAPIEQDTQAVGSEYERLTVSSEETEMPWNVLLIGRLPARRFASVEASGRQPGDCETDEMGIENYEHLVDDLF